MSAQRPTPRARPVPLEAMEAFRAVAPAIEGFAREHDLLIERYRGGRTAWELHFARRMGGEVRITISYRERTGHVLDVLVVWWLDDLAQRTRRFRSAKVGAYLRREPASILRARLADALRLVDGWTLDDLGPAYGPFQAAQGGTGRAPGPEEPLPPPVR